MTTDFADYEEIKARHTGSNGHDPDRRAIELLSFADMTPQLDGRPLVKRWLNREQLCLIRGEASCGKTFLALDIGSSRRRRYRLVRAPRRARRRRLRRR